MLKTRKLAATVSDTQLLPLHSSGSDSNIQVNNGVSKFTHKWFRNDCLRLVFHGKNYDFTP